MILNNSKYNQKWDKEKLLSLGDFSRGVSKHRPRNDEKLFEDGKYPFLQTGEIKEATLYVNDYSLKYNDFGLQQSKLWPKGTLCITIAANIAETAILGIDMCFPDSIVGFIPDKNKTTSEYMYYVFEYIKKQIQNRISGSIQDNINIDYLKGLEFRISPEQDKITNFLSNIDKKIINNEHIINTLESIAKTIYDYWFLQFDFPDENGKPYKSSGGKMVWNEELKREIPEGWEVKRLSDIIDVIDNRGKNPPFSERPTNYPILDVATLRSDGRCIDYNNCSKFVDSLTYNTWFRAGHPKTGDILFSTVGSLAETKIFIEGDVYGCIAQNVIGLRPHGSISSYLYQCLHSEKERIVGYKIGSVQPSLKVGHVLEHRINIPDESVLEKYEHIIKKVNKQIHSSIEEKRYLISLRDFLLPLLMNGQVGFK